VLLVVYENTQIKSDNGKRPAEAIRQPQPNSRKTWHHLSPVLSVEAAAGKAISAVIYYNRVVFGEGVDMYTVVSPGRRGRQGKAEE